MADRHYLDWAATTPLCAQAADAMQPYMRATGGIDVHANANSLYSEGRLAYEQLEQARHSMAQSIGAKRPSEVVFTSGATEADDAALRGIMGALSRAPQPRRHLVVSAIEHDAVFRTAHRLKEDGFEVDFVSCGTDGIVSADAVASLIRPDTALVSVMMANNEIGSIQPIANMVRHAHASGALFHTDAVQALGKIPVDVGELGVDAASFSAHKVGGPKGVGALYLRARTPFRADMLGGGQEAGLRSGTQNVAGALGCAAAVRAAVAGQPALQARLGALRDSLYAQLCSRPDVSPSVPCTKHDERYLPSIVNVCVDGFESETLILRLDMLGFAVSGGSACASHSLEPSRVLTELGIRKDRALGSLRISMGVGTEEEDIALFLEAFDSAIVWER